ncbi:MAG: heme exporter protein CcmB [Rickettsiales bacterium]
MDIVKFEFLKLLKKSRGWLGPILVFVLIMIAYPLTVEISNIQLSQSFFSILWIAALLVVMLATEDIFLEDFNDGSLEQNAISQKSLPLIIGSKIFVYWLVIGVPISILGSIFCIGITNQSNFGIQILPVLLVSTYIFMNVFSFGNALSLTKGSVLGTLVTLPLLLPLLIILGKVVIAINFNLNYYGFLFLLLGILSIIIIIIPMIISYIIRAHLE